MTENESRADEVQRALDRLCSYCADGLEPRRRPSGALGHRVFVDGEQRSGYRWYTCGRRAWIAHYLETRLAELAARQPEEGNER